MNENFSSLPQEDRPYERCIRHGVQSLSNRDLLAVILRTGAKGRNVLELAGDLLKLVPEREGFTGIRRLSLDELSKVKGIGKVKAVQLKCIGELSKRMGIEMPITEQLAKVLFEGEPAANAIKNLMGRPNRNETESTFLS